jgi:site-specific DNA recombinase
MRAVIYARYSSDLQSEASVEDQVQQCRDRAERDGHEVVNVFSDYAISGSSLGNRPGMLSLMAAAKDGLFDIVYAEALDRISRDQEDVAGIYKRLTYADALITTLSEGIINELHIGLKGTMNALFVKDLAVKTRRGLEGRVRKGKSGGGKAYGYDVVKQTDENGNPIRGDRTINEVEAGVIRRIFEMFAQGHSPRAIAKFLNGETIPGPTGRPWRDTTIRGHHTRRTGILRNDLYSGRLVWNKQRFVKDPITGKRLARSNPEDQWIYHDVPHLRIIDQELWNQVQARLDGIRHSPAVSNARDTRFWEHRRPRHLFTGLMICAECGSSMIAVGKDYIACDHARNQGTCSNRRGIKRGHIEEIVLGTLKTNLMQPHLVEEFTRAFHAEVNRIEKQRDVGRENTAKELDRITNKVEGLYAAIADGLRTSGLKAKLEEMEKQKQDLEAHLSKSPPPTPVLHPNLAELYRRKVQNLHSSLNNPDFKTEAAEIIRSLVESIRVQNHADEIEIELVGEIAKMVEVAQTVNLKGKTALEEAVSLENYRCSVKVVAGEGFEPPTHGL